MGNFQSAIAIFEGLEVRNVGSLLDTWSLVSDERIAFIASFRGNPRSVKGLEEAKTAMTETPVIPYLRK